MGYRETTAAEVIRTFGVTSRAQDTLERWSRNRREVADYVLAHRTTVPYSMRTADVEWAMKRTEHALGGIKKREIERVLEVRDWNPRFAMVHVLHYALESAGRPFTYQEFREFCENDLTARRMLTDPSLALLRSLGPPQNQHVVKKAIRWRVGLAYYSFLRELYVICQLRERGIDLKVHPLADTLFRVDAWNEGVVVQLYISNASFRSGSRGRKPKPATLLGNRFRYVEIEMDRQHVFGGLHVPSIRSLDAAAKTLREHV